MNVNENILNSLFNEFCKEKNKITNLKDVLIDEEYIDFYELEDELDKLEKILKSMYDVFQQVILSQRNILIPTNINISSEEQFLKIQSEVDEARAELIRYLYTMDKNRKIIAKNNYLNELCDIQVAVDGNQTHFITPEFVNRFSSKEKAFDEMLFFIANKSFEALKNNGDKDIYSINIIEEMLKEYPNSSILLNIYQQAKDFINSNSNEDYQLLLF